MTLQEMQRELMRNFPEVALREAGNASFLYVTYKRRVVEIFPHEGQWWMELWEPNIDDSEDSPTETVGTAEEAIEKTIKWLRHGE